MDAVANSTLRIGPGYQVDKAVVIGPGYPAPDVKVISPGACKGGDCGCDHCGEKKSPKVVQNTKALTAIERVKDVRIRQQEPSVSSMDLLRAMGIPPSVADVDLLQFQLPGGVMTATGEVYQALVERLLASSKTDPATSIWTLAGPKPTQAIVRAGDPAPADLGALGAVVGAQVLWLLVGGPYASSTP